jgi:hypothetical protein
MEHRSLLPFFAVLPCFAELYSPGGRLSYEKIEESRSGKSAMEQDQENRGGNRSMPGQLGHRDEDVELKDADPNLAE